MVNLHRVPIGLIVRLSVNVPVATPDPFIVPDIFIWAWVNGTPPTEGDPGLGLYNCATQVPLLNGCDEGSVTVAVNVDVEANATEERNRSDNKPFIVSPPYIESW